MNENELHSETFKLVEDATRIEGSHGWIQWKGTQVCMDVNCECGARLHFDEEFLYAVGCDNCGSTYAVGAYVKLVKMTDPRHIEFMRGRCFYSAYDENCKVDP